MGACSVAKKGEELLVTDEERCVRFWWPCKLFKSNFTLEVKTPAGSTEGCEFFEDGYCRVLKRNLLGFEAKKCVELWKDCPYRALKLKIKT
jgi:hypothetical protein